MDRPDAPLSVRLEWRPDDLCVSGPKRKKKITPRVREVLSLAADGFIYKEIADRMNISVHTVKFHIRSALTVLGARNLTGAVAIAIRTGLI